MGAIGEPVEIVEIPEPAPAEAPLTIPETWPAPAPLPTPAQPERVPA